LNDRGAEKATRNPREGEENVRMRGDPLFCKKAGFPRTPSGKKLLNGWGQGKQGFEMCANPTIHEINEESE
jgi:hypothetical protein